MRSAAPCFAVSKHGDSSCRAKRFFSNCIRRFQVCASSSCDSSWGRGEICSQSNAAAPASLENLRTLGCFGKISRYVQQGCPCFENHEAWGSRCRKNARETPCLGQPLAAGSRCFHARVDRFATNSLGRDDRLEKLNHAKSYRPCSQRKTSILNSPSSPKSPFSH